MKLGVIKTIVREELSKFGELPGWINPFLQTLNQFINAAGKALAGNLSFEDNFLCKVKTLDFTSGTEQPINPDTKLRVIGVIPTACSGLVIDKFGWVLKSDGTIGVTFNFASGTTAKCTVIILLG